MTAKRVAIIGAGSAGLAMVSQLLQVAPNYFDPVVFERRAQVGGIWQYDANSPTCRFMFDVNGNPYPVWDGHDDQDSTFIPPGPMYDGLRTNIPCDLMAYQDHPFPPDTNLFPSRSVVQRYIQNFAHQNQLTKWIRFQTSVVSVKRVAYTGNDFGQGSKWQVVSQCLQTKQTKTELYDFVVCASGRCNTPLVPFIDGLWNFDGQMVHSAWYRFPQQFRGKTVLVIGNSSSGCDIARELVGYLARDFDGAQHWTEQSNKSPPATGVKVYQSYQDISKSPRLDLDPRDPSSSEWAKRIQVVDKILRIERPNQSTSSKSHIVLQDGTVLNDIDVIVFGTGFAFDFTFLDQRLAPFSEHRLIPEPFPVSYDSQSDPSLVEYLKQHQDSKPYTPPVATSGLLTNLDDWGLFYRYDPSLVVLGTPVQIVPFPFTLIQARVVAAFWSHQLKEYNRGLPQLDTSLAGSDPNRWSSWKQQASFPNQTGYVAETFNLGFPADTAYQDNLLALLGETTLRKSGSDATKTVQGFHGTLTETDPSDLDQKEEELIPTQATDEGWLNVAEFRNQRRQTGKRLRRQVLGY